MPSLHGINYALLEDLNSKVTSWARCTIVETGSGEWYLHPPPPVVMTRRTVFRAWKSCTWAKQLLVYSEFISTVNLVMDISPLCFGCQEAQSPKSDFSNSKYKAANSLLRRTPWKLEGSEAPRGWRRGIWTWRSKQRKRWVRCLGREARSQWGEGWRRKGEGTTGESESLRTPLRL